jgi:DTW domain-containing protein YfiP
MATLYIPAMSADNPKLDPADCPRCLKPATLCVCDEIAPIDNRTELLILQHPQEQDRLLGSARLAALHFRNATFRIGLSWPSLSKILGRDVDPKRWAILYLGSLKAEALAPGHDLVVVSGKGETLPDQDRALRDIDGVILLDGTWSQAKAIWWRNAWMLKCRRVLLARTRPSRYGKLRKEPHKDGLSTIEAAAMLMARLERDPKIEAALNTTFAHMLDKYRAVYGKTRPEKIAKRR